MKLDIVRAWKDEAYRASLTQEQQTLLPANPAGELEMSDADLATVVGAGGYGNDDCNDPCNDPYGDGYGYGHGHRSYHRRSSNGGYDRGYGRCGDGFRLSASFGFGC